MFVTKVSIGSISSVIVVGFITAALYALGSGPSAGIQGGRQEAIVYYANETIPEVLSSPNYKIFLRVLNAAASPAAGEIREALLEDARSSPAILARDRKALLEIARREQLYLFFFTNGDALRQRYLYYDPFGAKKDFKEGYLLSQQVADNALLEDAPLARPEYFRAALDEVIGQLEHRASIALIVRSHGSYSMPLIPRLNLNLSIVDETSLLRFLDGGNADDLGFAGVKLQGTSQLQLWQIIDGASSNGAAIFPLVFLSSCDSGPTRFEETASFPASVRSVIHSGESGFSSEALSYSAMLADDRFDRIGLESVVARLSTGLLNSGQTLYADTRFSIWRWPAIRYARGLGWWLAFTLVPGWAVIFVVIWRRSVAVRQRLVGP